MARETHPARLLRSPLALIAAATHGQPLRPRHGRPAPRAGRQQVCTGVGAEADWRAAQVPKPKRLCPANPAEAVPTRGGSNPPAHRTERRLPTSPPHGETVPTHQPTARRRFQPTSPPRREAAPTHTSPHRTERRLQPTHTARRGRSNPRTHQQVRPRGAVGGQAGGGAPPPPPREHAGDPLLGHAPHRGARGSAAAAAAAALCPARPRPPEPAKAAHHIAAAAHHLAAVPPPAAIIEGVFPHA